MGLSNLKALWGKVRERAWGAQSALVLMYHRVLPDSNDDPLTLKVSLSHFGSHLEVLKRHCRVIALHQLGDELGGSRFRGPRTVVITFDDGYGDNYVYAFPLLKRRGLVAIFFLATDYIEKQELFPWERLRLDILQTSQEELRLGHGTDSRVYPLASLAERGAAIRSLADQLRTLPQAEWSSLLEQIETRLGVSKPYYSREDLPMSWLEVAEMAQSGFEFGAHTCSHPSLAHLRKEEMEGEIQRSKRTLEQRLSDPIATFAYPYGGPSDISDDVIATVAKAGFRMACTAFPGANSVAQHPLLLRRLHVQDWDGNSFLKVLARAFSPTDGAR